jgi:Tol biopolymer transport system component
VNRIQKNTAITTQGLTSTAQVFYLQGYPGDIYRISPNGTSDTKLTTDNKNGNFDISSDGKKMVFGNMAKNNWNIYTADISSTGIINKQLVFNGKYRDEDCRFNPTATKVVFKTNQFGVAEQGNSNVYDIAVLTLATGTLTRLTFNTNKEAWAPCFSADGTKVAFVLRDIAIGDPSNEIYIVNVDGTGLKQITNNNYDDWFPAFSSTGNLIYISKKIASCDDDLYQIPAAALTLANPESQSVLLNINQCNLVSDADPYGSKTNENNLVFVSTRAGRYGVYTADKSTGVVSLVVKKTSVDLLGPVLIE